VISRGTVVAAGSRPPHDQSIFKGSVAFFPFRTSFLHFATSSPTSDSVRLGGTAEDLAAAQRSSWRAAAQGAIRGSA